mgnify:CR=1 FL=1
MKLPWKLPLLLDGATGTQFMAAGMAPDACPEQWAFEHPDVVTAVQRRYVLAGSDVLYTPTFGANRARLSDFGLGDKVAELNKSLAELTMKTAKASKSRVLVAGGMSPTGLFPVPWGETPFSVFEEIFSEQATALYNAGVDLLVCETMTNLTEARAALLAARHAGLPVIVTFTIDKNGRTMSGARLLPCVITLQSLGAAAVGLNCSEGVTAMDKPLAEALPHAAVPLVAKPNAMNSQGELSPLRFGQEMQMLFASGAVIVGGCCGTTPEHIAVLRGVVDNHPLIAPREIDISAVAVESEAFFIDDNIEFCEPIPCDSDLAQRLIEAEDCSNAALLQISCQGDVDNLIEFGGMSRLPIALHTDNAVLLDDALHRFTGRLIVDSLCEIERPLLEDIASKYGAVVF